MKHIFKNSVTAMMSGIIALTVVVSAATVSVISAGAYNDRFSATGVSSEVYNSVPEPTFAITSNDVTEPVNLYDNSEYSAPDWKRSDNKIYFYANPKIFSNFKNMYLYLYSHTDSDVEMIPWLSKKGRMTYEGNDIWSFDLESKGYSLDSNRDYGCIFSNNNGVATCDVIINPDCYGDIAYCNGNLVENSIDSNKRAYLVQWASGKHSNPKCITSIGNIIGEEYWSNETPYSLFLRFITGTGINSIKNAIKFNGKTEQKTIDDTAAALGFSFRQVKQVVADARAQGASLDWQPERSPMYVPEKPEAPTLKLKSMGNGNVRAEWNAVPDAAKYIIYTKWGNDTHWQVSATTETSTVFGTTSKNTVLKVQVQGVSASGLEGAYSKVLSITVNPTSKPAAPVPTLSNKSNGIRAEWNKVSGAVKYKVYYKKNSDSNWSSTETVNNYYPLLNLTAGTQYAVQVQSIGVDNLKGNYSVVKRLVYVPQVKPVVTLSNKSNGIRAEWKKISGATKYVVYYRKSTDSKWSSAETSNNYYPLLSLTAETKYSVQVQAVFGSAKGMYSTVSSMVYVPQVKPAVILSNKSNGIRAEWKKVSGATKYIVYYKKNSDSKWNSTETANLYYPLLKLTKGTQYAVQVQPVFGGSKGLYSAVARLVYQPPGSK